MPLSNIQQAIVRAAQESGIDPATALAFAERESSFNPGARSSKTIRGLFQMRGDLRGKYGVGDTDDPYEQAAGWGRFAGDLRKEMSGGMGRDPNDAELYLGHHFGGRRAVRMLSKLDPGTSVGEVFTPYELSINPHIVKAGTIGALTSSTMGDIDRRRAKYGGQTTLADFSSFGDLVPDQQPAGRTRAPRMAAAAPDFSQFGTPVS